MPVIILGQYQSPPLLIDPDFDDGGLIQTITTALPQPIAIRGSGEPLPVQNIVISTVASGSSFFTVEVISTQTESVVNDTTALSTFNVQTITATPTPNIVPSPGTPPSSTPDAGPTVDDFTDNIFNILPTVVVGAGGFITSSAVTNVDPTPIPPVVGTNFTTGDVTNGTVLATQINATNSGTVDGASTGTVFNINPQIVP